MARLLRSLAKKAENDVDYTTDTVYLITWNPSDKFFRDYLSQYHVHKWDKMCFHVLKHLTRCCSKFCVIPEVSDMGRLHCHGWIVIRDKIKWNKSVLPTLRRHGMFKANRLRHANGYRYYKKDVSYLRNYIMDRPLCISHQSIKRDLEEIRQSIVNNCVLESSDLPEESRRSILDYSELFLDQ